MYDDFNSDLRRYIFRFTYQSFCHTRIWKDNKWLRNPKEETSNNFQRVKESLEVS